ncbi:MAG: hypothetical protein L6420_04175 [Elusimicrobia bacterium]|nr:hypothetical protein [Elusimicrobiota bacterium]
MFKPGALFRKTHEGTTERLLQLAAGYFGTYVITGSLVKFFMAAKEHGGMGMTGIEFLVYSTLISSLFCISLVIYWKWYKFKSNNYTTFLGIYMPKEFLYIIPSGVLTAIIIPTTTLLYTFKGVSVMVAMIIMRGSVIIVSRIIDSIQIKQGILHKKVYREENIGVIFAISAVALKLVFVEKGDFDFIHNFAFMAIFLSYIIAYAIRIYIMNFYKNTRPKNAIYDYKGFFGIEQISASATIIISMIVILLVSANHGSVIDQFQQAVSQPHERWLSAVWAGIPYGIGAFFSVFLFMFQGRTATFAGLTNRLTSLIAGTVATLVVWQWIGNNPPKIVDWIGLFLIFIAIYFMGRGEKKRTAELLKAHEIVEEED